MAISQLGYLVLNVSNPAAWRTLATDILGAEERKDSPPGEIQLRLDERHRRITLRKADSDSIVAIGWEVPTMAALGAARKALQERGIAVTEATASEAQERGVLALIRFRDLNRFPVEIYFGPWFDDMPFRPSRPMTGFNCGALGLGHVVLVCSDVRKAADFYQEALGFRLTDYIAWEGADVVFLHCNPRHHSLGLINEVFGLKAGNLQHFFLEVNALADVGRAYDLVQSRKVPLQLTLGCHSNDQTTSFYFTGPSNFAIEYGWGGIQVDDANWQIKHYYSPKLWGHNRPQAEGA
jgi:2,3-dihydroxybiphenyl 1,2-dioxygenase